jgi:TRAP-type C4-dicarboxylate transport system permease small subunit
MSKGIVTAVISAATVAAGCAVTVPTYQRLSSQGAFSARGLTHAGLDLTAAMLLLVGVALLIAGVIIALAAVAQFWFDRQDARDAAYAEQSARRASLTASLPPSVANTHPRRRVVH